MAESSSQIGESESHSNFSSSVSAGDVVAFSPAEDLSSMKSFRPRLLAVKSSIQDLVNGVAVQKDGMEFTVTPLGEWVSRAHVIGIAVDSFSSNANADGGGSYATLTIDDSSGILLRLKSWDAGVSARIRGIKVGCIVDVIGRVRRFQSETYIVPEIVREVKDVRIEKLRKLELLDKRKALEAVGAKILELLNDEFADDPEGLIAHASEKLGIPNDLVEGVLAFEYESRRLKELKANAIESETVKHTASGAPEDDGGGGSQKKDAVLLFEELKKKILQLLESNSHTGLEYSQLCSMLENAPGEEVDKALEALSDEGEIFEPRGGIFKRLV